MNNNDNFVLVGLIKYVSLHNRSVTSSQLEFFRMLDEKIEKVFTIYIYITGLDMI